MQEKVSFYSSGSKISGILFKPEEQRKNNVSDSRPGIVLCQGYAGLKEQNLPFIAGKFARSGFTSLIFDYRGFGESEGRRNRLIPREQVEDVQNALTYIETRSEVNPALLGLFGTSYGGSIAAYATALDERVRCTVSMMGVGDGKRWLHGLRREWEWLAFLKQLKDDRRKRVLTGESELVHKYDIMPTTPEGMEFWKIALKEHPEHETYAKLTLESGDAILEFKPEEVSCKISSCATLYISAENDTLTPIIEQRNMYQKTCEPKKHVIVPNADHHELYSPRLLEMVTKISTNWFVKYLCEGFGSSESVT